MQFSLVRGLTRDQFHWAHFPALLQKAFPVAELEMLDLPGNGEHCRVTSPVGPRDYVEFLRRHSKFVGQRRKTIIIAVSLGAMIAYEWVKKYPEEIEALVFLNTSMRPTSIFHRLRPPALLHLIQLIGEKDCVIRERRVLELTTATINGDRLDQYAASWGEHAQRYPMKPLSAFNQLLTAWLIRRDPEPPAVPTLILRSLADRLVNPVSSEDLARAWKAPLETHWAAGHDLTLDAPEWVVKKISYFVNARLPSNRSGLL